MQHFKYARKRPWIWVNFPKTERSQPCCEIGRRVGFISLRMSILMQLDLRKSFRLPRILNWRKRISHLQEVRFCLLNALFHPASPAFTQKHAMFDRWLEVAVTTIVTAPWVDVGHLFIIINNACIITFCFIIFFFTHLPSPRLSLSRKTAYHNLKKCVKGTDEKAFLTEQRDEQVEKWKGNIAQLCPVSELQAFQKRKIVLSGWKRRIIKKNLMERKI